MSDYIQIARVIGNTNNNDKMHKDDFYTLCLKNPQRNKGLRKQSKNNQLPVFKFDDIEINYLCSDFVRFCLGLYKINGHIDTGELALIPKQEIPISKELKEYIEEFLPDYYGIRNIS